jgi:hypothetical protein
MISEATVHEMQLSRVTSCDTPKTTRTLIRHLHNTVYPWRVPLSRPHAGGRETGTASVDLIVAVCGLPDSFREASPCPF